MAVFRQLARGSVIGSGDYVFRHYGSEVPNYLTFSSPQSFTIGIDGEPGWDGTLYYSTNGTTWNAWDGSIVESGDDNELYFYGSGNTFISGAMASSFVISGEDVSCSGNIETLLDAETVARGEHPVMAEACYYTLFYDCSALISAPELPATTLSDSCYQFMFFRCSLESPPSLPATTLAYRCYSSMFTYCPITTPPVLPATTMAEYCYYQMFAASSLTTAPILPATTLAEYCYAGMFLQCEDLVSIMDVLPADTMEQRCYSSMFANCTSINSVPALPATTLAANCYYKMFNGCTSLTKVPKLPATTLADECYKEMFSGCESLYISQSSESPYTNAWRIPSSGSGVTATDWNTDMLSGTAGYTTDPEIDTTYYTNYAPVGVKSYSVTLSGLGEYGWEPVPSGTSPANPDPTLYDGVYRSTNYNEDDSNAVMRIDFTGYDTISLYIRSYAESNYDYTLVSELDASSIPTSSDDAYESTKGNQQSGTGISDYTHVTFSTDGGDHFVYVVYRKDYSESEGDDRGCLLIEK